jgi:hypothetical protein
MIKHKPDLKKTVYYIHFKSNPIEAAHENGNKDTLTTFLSR